MRRGEPYTLQEFQNRYRLVSQEAERLYKSFGPDKIELDLLMAMKLERGPGRPQSSRRRSEPDRHPA